MRSTFMGLEASKRGLFTQQSALYTTGHNISNANTVGYSRQRVNMETTPGFPGTGLNTPMTAGHIGTGVVAQSVQRVRDEFVDRQYRQETNKLGYWEATTRTIAQMEDIMSEPSEFGINQAFTDFWESMEDVVTNPKDTAARQVMLSKGQSLAESFNYMDTQLKLIQGNIGNEINVVTGEANNLLKQIAALNDQIKKVEPNGYMPNDLYDARDVLLDKLNEIIPVSISYEKSGGNSLEIAEGSMTVAFKPIGAAEPIILVHGKQHAELVTTGADGRAVDGDVDGDPTNLADPTFSPFSQFVFKNAMSKNPGFVGTSPISETNPLYLKNTADAEVDYEALEQSKGKLSALIDSYGFEDATGDLKGIYPEMLAQLDKLAGEFVDKFNAIHTSGYDLNGDSGKEFFETDGTTAGTIKVVANLNPEDIAASDALGEEGNNKKILELAALQASVVKDLAGTPTLEGGTFQSFYKSLIGQLGVKGDQSKTLEFNSGTLQLQIANNRASQNSVSLDEEMTNMITFQQAYNANARMITVIDETLDKIINGMGRVGL